MNQKTNNNTISELTGLFRTRYLAFIVALVLGFAFQTPALLHAQDTNAPAAEALTDEPDANLRDPFLPPGFPLKANTKPPEIKPPTGPTNVVAVLPPEGPAKWPPPPSVKGLTKVEGKWRAILDSGIGLVEAGETVRQRVGNNVFIWKVALITEKGVSLKPVEIRSGR